MADPLRIDWLGVEDPAPAPIRLTQKAVRAAAESRGVPCAERDWAPVRGIVCQTRLDATLDPRFAPEGSCRGIDAVEVRWAETLRDEAPLRAVALALDAALRLDRLVVCFLHALPQCLDTRLAVPLHGDVALDRIYSHCGIVSCLPCFQEERLQAAASFSQWHDTLFDFLKNDADRLRLECEYDRLQAAMRRERDFAQKNALRKRLLEVKAALDAL